MLIVKHGIHRICSEAEYLNEYKSLGYLVVTEDSEPKQEEQQEEQPKTKRGRGK
jgi:hypothetical protein